jgi:hypothetical protein
MPRLIIKSDGTLNGTRIIDPNTNSDIPRITHVTWHCSWADGVTPRMEVEMLAFPAELEVEADVLVRTINGKRFKLVPLEEDQQ